MVVEVEVKDADSEITTFDGLWCFSKLMLLPVPGGWGVGGGGGGGGRV